jgi:putative pyruvate formate lyase activating enzyme
VKDYTPGYIKLSQTGELDNRIKTLKEMLRSCVVCPHHCNVDRVNNERGFCRAGLNMVIGGYGPHYGEESVLVGTGGSGTIFFSYQ